MNVKGIFVDEFGFDFQIKRSKQNKMVKYVHSNGLIAFVNATDPDDVFGSFHIPIYNPNGVAPLVNSNDIYLAQSYQIVNGAFQIVSDWTTKANKMVTYKQQFGSKMACITTTDNSPFDQNKMDYAYFSTVLYNFDYFGWGEFDYSAMSTSLSFRTRKTFYGTNFINNINNSNGIYERNTNIGIKINVNNHTVDILTV